MVNLKLGVDICFGLKRWPEPIKWMDIVKDFLNLDIVEFDSDFLDPFFIEEKQYMKIAGEIRDLAIKKEIFIHNYFSGNITHASNMFSNPDKRFVSFGELWYEKAIKIASKMGTLGIGSHFNTIPSRSINSKDYNYYLDVMIDTIIGYTEIAFNEKLKILMLEQMYSPAEPPYTIKQTYEIFNKINKRSKLFVSPVVDVGHMCCQNFPHSEEDRNPYLWLKEFGSICEVVHLQQTSSEKSNHWPFTGKYNSKGFIKPELIIEALEKSASKENYLILEIFFPLNTNDEEVLNDMLETVKYWKGFLS